MKMIEIDSDKFREVVENILGNSKFKSYSELSESMGFARSYISNCICYNRIAVVAANDLERRFGISVDEYIKKDETTEEIKDDTKKPISDFTGEELKNLIYKAVYSAVLHAWQNDDE